MDLISRGAAAEAIYRALKTPVPDYRKDPFHDTMGLAYAMANEIPSAQPEQRWIPCSSGNLPQTTDPVNITWTNRNPEPYYASIKDVPFTATGHYCNGKWWWYSSTCQDYLDEYGESEVDRVDDGIEILAWQPLPPAFDGEKS